LGGKEAKIKKPAKKIPTTRIGELRWRTLEVKSGVRKAVENKSFWPNFTLPPTIHDEKLMSSHDEASS
jgi:hypothetical protein